MKLSNITLLSIMGFLMMGCGGGGGDSSTPDSLVVVEQSVSVLVEPPIVIDIIEPDPNAIYDTAAELVGVEKSVSVLVEPLIVIDIIEPDPNAIYDTTAELVASKSFLLEQEYELAISYKNDGNRNAYLSVCTDFTDGEEGIKINYNSCLLRTAIEDDYAGTVTVANDKHRLVMAIWYFDDTKNPRYGIWKNDEGAIDVRKFDVN